MKKKGIDINIVSVALFCVVAAIMTAFWVFVATANTRVRQQTEIEENRRQCEAQSRALADASDYLTNEVWRYVATGQSAHMRNYWLEANDLRRRERAIAVLGGLSLTEEELALVRAAKDESDALMIRETWAMRLIADSYGVPTDYLPAEVAAVVYTDGEEQLSSEEKQALATSYIFGPDYNEVKIEIKESIETFRTTIRERKNTELAAAVEETRVSLEVVQILMGLLILAFVSEAVLYYCFILRPLHAYNTQIRKMGDREYMSLIPVGSRVTKSFAESFNSMYADWRERNEKLEQERHRFRIALENTPVILYEYDFETDEFTAYGTLLEGDGNASERIIPNFFRDYIPQTLSEEEANRLFEVVNGTEVRLQVKPTPDWAADKIWVGVTGTSFYDESGKLVRAIGKIMNIQAEKEREAELEDARSRDGLTGLYAKEAGIRRVKEYLDQKKSDEICGMMLLDMDDFARVNAVEGRTFADAVLQEVSAILVGKTGKDDILVRLGGDEFMIFAKNCPKSRATILGPEIADAIQSLSLPQNPDLRISASIGMCVTEVVEDYHGLYRSAESTLKYVKEHGKGKAACFRDVSTELGTVLTQVYPNPHRINEIDRSELTTDDLASFALDLLGKSKNLNDAVHLLLARIGYAARADRIILAEYDKEYLRYRVLYYWVKDRRFTPSPDPKYLTEEEFDRLTNAYDDEGLCDGNVLGVNLEMKSMLHAAIWSYGNFVGSFCFERTDEHIWTEDERKLIGELAKIISTFTLKARADAVSRAKTDFLSRMSHEIRTPMNAITGMTAIAKTALDDPSRMSECLDKIDSANKYLLSLINDVLDMSRIESGKVEIHPTAVDFCAWIGDLETLMRPQADLKGISFVVENEFREKRPVCLDGLRLNQVLVNLLGNAFKFTDDGGTVTLRISPVKTADGAKGLRFSVKDNGIGIGEEAQKRIFNAFEQADGDTAARYGGTGLGLAISARLAELMGSAIEVHSVPGEGSEFFFTLALRYACAPARTSGVRQKAEATKFDPKGKRLLIAEDNDLNREIAVELLRMQGFEAETAQNGAEAVELFERNAPGYYDAILMDIRMPVMDGMEATRRIRTSAKADAREIPIVAMSANAFDEDTRKSLENGMNGHIPKPIDVDKLLSTLKTLISERKA